MKITWKLYRTYDEAKNCQQSIYLHEWSAKPFYWGMLGKTKFGGNAQAIENGKLNPRYGSSYKHWIEGCLRHGGILYIGIITEQGNASIEQVEKQLIHDYPSEMNPNEPSQQLTIEHQGDVPISIITKKP